MREIEQTFRIPLMLEYSRIFSKTIVANVSTQDLLEASYYFLAVPVEGAIILSIFENIHVAQLRKHDIETGNI